MKMPKLFKGVILGAPASGKGTISKKIVKTFNVVHVSSGDLLRKLIEEKNPLQNSVNKYVMHGRLVPDVLIMKIVLEKLKQLTEKNWLCDGFPRTLVQAEKLFKVYPLNLAINLKVPFDVITQRVKDRWVHNSSGRVYHLEYNPPKVPGKDDITGEPLVQRLDDQPEVVLQRLNIYAKTTEPLLEFYKSQGILKEFSGKTSDEMWESIEEVLKKSLHPN